MIVAGGWYPLGIVAGIAEHYLKPPVRARETDTANPAKPAKPRSGAGKLAGFRVRANPLNPAGLRGLRVVRVIPAGSENAAGTVVCAGQQGCCGVCVLCGVTFSPARIARGTGRARSGACTRSRRTTSLYRSAGRQSRSPGRHAQLPVPPDPPGILTRGRLKAREVTQALPLSSR